MLRKFSLDTQIANSIQRVPLITSATKVVKLPSVSERGLDRVTFLVLQGLVYKQVQNEEIERQRERQNWH